jgi:sulfate adenylyltransferase
MDSLIAPHGGTLVNRLVEAEQAAAVRSRAEGLPRITLNDRQASDFEMIATGGLSPLTGFMNSAAYESVINTRHLPTSAGQQKLAWTIPITLAPEDSVSEGLQVGQEVALYYSDGTTLAGVMKIEEKYPLQKEKEAQNVYRTTDEAHPGVAAVNAQGATALAGDITAVALPPYTDFPEQRLTPAQTRAKFSELGWKTVVAFQTRNPIHRAHEYLQKCALESVDGLLVHPLVGATKGDDIPADVRMQCYIALLSNYYPPERTMLAVNPAAMRYAGPSEAIFHAIIRKNYGCTHFIVGRDHAGVGNYYGTYDAQTIFDEFEPEAIGITPMKFEHSFWCNECEGMASGKTCPHGKEHHVALSGTKVREMLRAGEIPPREFTRPEVAKVLIAAMQNGA